MQCSNSAVRCSNTLGARLARLRQSRRSENHLAILHHYQKRNRSLSLSFSLFEDPQDPAHHALGSCVTRAVQFGSRVRCSWATRISFLATNSRMKDADMLLAPLNVPRHAVVIRDAVQVGFGFPTASLVLVVVVLLQPCRSPDV